MSVVALLEAASAALSKAQDLEAKGGPQRLAKARAEREHARLWTAEALRLQDRS